MQLKEGKSKGAEQEHSKWSGTRSEKRRFSEQVVKDCDDPDLAPNFLPQNFPVGPINFGRTLYFRQSTDGKNVTAWMVGFQKSQ